MNKATWLTACCVAICALDLHAQSEWKIDKAHSSVQFEVSHLMVSSVVGSFRKFSGTVTEGADSFAGGKLVAEIEVESVDTGNGQRDAHLKAEDFFNSAQYPLIRFESTSIRKESDQTFRIEGNLTLRGVTKPVVLSARYGGQVASMGGRKAGFRATGSINRFDFGLAWNNLMETGGAMVGSMVEFRLMIELNKTS